jgi:hypothetical protein
MTDEREIVDLHPIMPGTLMKTPNTSARNADDLMIMRNILPGISAKRITPLTAEPRHPDKNTTIGKCFKISIYPG